MKKRIISLILTIFVLTSPLFSVNAATPEELQGVMEYRLVRQVAELIESDYKFGTTSEEMVNAALFRKLVHPTSTVEDLLDEMLSSLDPHSQYMYKEEYEYLLEHTITGEFVGIGISIQQRNGRIIVVSPIKGSPAESAGILPNDVIVSADGIDLIGKTTEFAQSVITGQAGTPVIIGVQRGDMNLTFEIIRATITETSVYYEILDGNIGYLSVSDFNGSTLDETKEALAEFDKNNVTKIIMDLRNNPGGELNSAVGFCNLFVPKGAIATVKYKDESRNEVFYSDLENPKYTLAVLINEGSASAAELFSAAVKDTKVGKLFGETSFGKGTMQTIYVFQPTGGAIRLTVAEYFSAGGNAVNDVGVEPDVFVQNRTKTKDSSYFAPIEFGVDLTEGSSSEAVLAVEQRLEFLGYLDGVPDNNFDSETTEALSTYQTYLNIPVTGIADFNTLFSLNNIEYELLRFIEDKQFDAAYEYLAALN